MKKNWLHLIAIVGLVTLLIVSFATPATAATLTSRTTLSLSAYSIMIGSSVTETTTVKGPAATSPIPTGTVTFQQLAPGSGTWTTFATKTLVNGTATITYRPTTTGAYWFRAVYSGDVNYTSSRSDAGNLGLQLTVKSPPICPRR
jgi:hypothetical protein